MRHSQEPRAAMLSLVVSCLAACCLAGQPAPVPAPVAAPAYKAQLGIPFCKVVGKELKLNAFLPENADKPAPAMVEIHGGWWCGGGPARKVENIAGWQTFTRKGIALFPISYRLGKEGGFPQNIRDCRNAIRFLRRNAQRFNIDPEHIGCMGISAGGQLSLMVAMVPEEFDDGGPTEELKGISASVCNAFAIVAPTDLVRQWDEAPRDEIPEFDGTVRLRPPDGRIPDDARPHHRILFKGITPDTEECKALYTRMSPIGHVRKDISPLLICDGEKDTIVPGLHGKALHEKLQAVGADSTYWLTPNGGHGYPGGKGFQKVLDDFLTRTLELGAQ
ncbi:MAG: alpha/beta hydrolase [Planctomycetota bacterium]|nr:alpha/beta hydrolase [Planctomycetota bacterium]